MTRRVFFSFHYEDVWRVQQIRQMGAFAGKEVVRFNDAANYEKLQRQGDAAIKRWIDHQLNGTSVTVVLIGTDTWQRTYVKYEIEESYKRGNGLLGIHINGLQDVNRLTKSRGRNPFEFVQRRLNNYEKFILALSRPHVGLGALWALPAFRMPTLASLANIYPHESVTDPYTVIRKNIGNWIETAARNARR